MQRRFNMQQHVIFPTCVYINHLAGNDRLNKALVKDILEWKAELKDESKHASNAINTWHGPTNAFQREPFAPLVKLVLAATTDVYEQQGYKVGTSPRLAGMWPMVGGKGGWNVPHSHTGGQWAGVYHVTAPEGSGRLVFQDSQLDRDLVARGAHYEEESAREKFHVPTVAGQLIIFPEWLIHYVEPHQGDDPRISVSFNLRQYVPQEGEKPVKAKPRKKAPARSTSSRSG